MILSIGDIHGRKNWKQFIKSGDNDLSRFDKNSKRSQYLDDIINKYDKIIFVGDYLDQFPFLSDEQIISNFLDIISLKKLYPEKIILLWGNHEIHYYPFSTQVYDGKRRSYEKRASVILRENAKLFDLGYIHKNYIWTHAGVSQFWVKAVIRNNSRFFNESSTIADIIELCNGSGWLPEDVLSFSSPLWVRDLKYSYPIAGYNQIFGHTEKDNITIDVYDRYNVKLINIDCVGNNICHLLKV